MYQDTILVQAVRAGVFLRRRRRFVCRPLRRIGGGRAVFIEFQSGLEFTKANGQMRFKPASMDHDWTIVSRRTTFKRHGHVRSLVAAWTSRRAAAMERRTWYRKTFTAPASIQGEEVFLEFEGVRQVAEVYLNGELPGEQERVHPFGFDLTPHLRFDGTNVLR